MKPNKIDEIGILEYTAFHMTLLFKFYGIKLLRWIYRNRRTAAVIAVLITLFIAGMVTVEGQAREFERDYRETHTQKEIAARCWNTETASKG